MTLTRFARLRIHRRSHHPPGRPWWALMDQHLKRKSWQNMQTVISCIGLIATIWQQATTTPAFQSLTNIRINYSTTAVVSTVAGFQSSTLLHVPSCFFKFCDTYVLDPATIWPFEFVGFFTFHTPSFCSELLDLQKTSPKSRAFILVVEPQPNRISLEASVGTWKMIVYIFTYIYNYIIHISYSAKWKQMSFLLFFWGKSWFKQVDLRY